MEKLEYIDRKHVGGFTFCVGGFTFYIRGFIRQRGDCGYPQQKNHVITAGIRKQRKAPGNFYKKTARILITDARCFLFSCFLQPLFAFYWSFYW